MDCKTLDFTQGRIVIPGSQEPYDCPILLSRESSQIEVQEKGTYMEPAVSWNLGDRTGSPRKPMQLEFAGKSIELLFAGRIQERAAEREREREREKEPAHTSQTCRWSP